jgi:DNA invertase Pin-like site-specific DNA recombinase
VDEAEYQRHLEVARQATREIQRRRELIHELAVIRQEAVAEMIEKYGASETARQLGISRGRVYAIAGKRKSNA